MFGFAVSPGGVGLEQSGGWMVEASQKMPWAGKRALRGAAATAEADAARGDLGDARLQLAEAAKMALADYYQAVRQAEVNRATAALLQASFARSPRASTRWPRPASRTCSRPTSIWPTWKAAVPNSQRDRRVAVARINTLLHRAADYPCRRRRPRVAVADGAARDRVAAAVGPAVPARPGRAIGPHPHGGSQPGVGRPRSIIPTSSWWPSTMPSCRWTFGRKWG